MTINFPELARQAAADGVITAEEVLDLRRAAWPDGRIDQTEAEAILAINEVVSPNAAEWQRLFVHGVGNYLQGWTAGRALSRDGTNHLESFMNDHSSSLGGFFSRMSRVGAQDLRAAAQDLLGSAPARDYAGEAGADAALTSPERSWLDGKIAADGRTDPLEDALLAFLAEG